MSFRRRFVHLRPASIAIAVVVALAAIPAGSSADPSLGQLNSELDQVQSSQQSLSASIGSLSQTISSLASQISLVQSREAAVRADLARDEAQLARTRAELKRERKLVALLKARLARARMILARQLVSSYESDRPDIVHVVLDAQGFTQLLEQFDFLRRAERQQQSIITITRTDKAEAEAAERRLAGLETIDVQITNAAVVRARALEGMNVLLQSKQDAMQQARAAQETALAAGKARGADLRGAIAHVQAEQAAAAAAQQAALQRAARQSTPPQSSGQGPASSSGSASAPTTTAPAMGASGGWVIPNPIVLCESGGQNLPPNSAGASGYYQIIPSTWAAFGGAGSSAYQASKAEQDAVAGRIWAGGGGASNWACAGMVGIH
jgi:septal ring factor EnvC (AmiA/AmiB activator)